MLQELIKKQEEVLHPNHYLINGIKEIIIQRLMLAIKEYNADMSKVAPEKVVAAYKLRTRMFRDIATVLEVVDSVGAGWLGKLEKMKAEEEEAIYNSQLSG